MRCKAQIGVNKWRTFLKLSSQGNPVELSSFKAELTHCGYRNDGSYYGH